MMGNYGGGYVSSGKEYEMLEKALARNVGNARKSGEEQQILYRSLTTEHFERIARRVFDEKSSNKVSLIVALAALVLSIVGILL